MTTVGTQNDTLCSTHKTCHVKKNFPKAVGVYVYAGGFSLGVRKHFDIVAHCEDPKPYGEEVIDMNRGDFWCYKMPVHPFGYWHGIPEGIDLLYANPPCAPFSNNNVKSYKKDSWRKDPRIACWKNIVDLSRTKDAKCCVIETVPQAYTKAEVLVKATLNSLPYSYRYLIFHNIALMGSIQNRNRLFIVGSDFPLLLDRHGFKLPTDTVIDRLDAVTDKAWGLKITPKYENIVNASLPGEAMRDAFNRIIPEEQRQYDAAGRCKGRPSFNIKRLIEDQRVNTLCGFAHIHPYENRYVTVNEYKVMADYPVDYKLPGKCESYGYCSRAVSPVAGEWIARIVKESMEHDHGSTDNDEESVVIFDGISHGETPKILEHALSEPFPKIKMRRPY